MKEKLLLLHGALGSKNQFLPIKEKLSTSFEVYDLNFAGHGGVHTEEAYSIDLFTQNVIDYLDQSEIDQVTIFGYSMGGYVGLNTALKAPNRIKKVITLGTKFNWSLSSAKKEVGRLNPAIIETKVPHFAQKLQREHYPLDWKIVMEKTAAMMLAMGHGARLKDEELQAIQVPVVVGIGGMDAMVSYEESAYAADLIPNVKLIKLEGAKHPIETVDQDVLIAFVSNNT